MALLCVQACQLAGRRQASLQGCPHGCSQHGGTANNRHSALLELLKQSVPVPPHSAACRVCQLQARLVQDVCLPAARKPHTGACKLGWAEPATPCRQWCLGWPANFAATNPHTPVVAVVGDHPEAQLREAGSGQVLSQLVGHADFSFAAAWHPAGHLLATGNQVRLAMSKV